MMDIDGFRYDFGTEAIIHVFLVIFRKQFCFEIISFIRLKQILKAHQK